MKASSTVAEAGGQVVALCGGIGGAKLALGLYHLLGSRLTVVVNTGDDFEHMGLTISPDLDTVLYTLGGVADAERGWGRAGESWQFMSALRELGGETWFQLGDLDLAMHIERTRWLREGRTLSAFVAHAAKQLGIAAQVLPMTEDKVRTVVQTDIGDLPFQRYFVEQRCGPKVRAVHFEGADHARPAPAVLATLARHDLRMIVICPSNPYLSVDPILAVSGMRAAIKQAAAPVVAVSPIIGGLAVKGPTAKIMAELGVEPTSETVARHYDGLLSGLIIDEKDAPDAARLDIPVHVTSTLMRDLADRRQLAAEVVSFADGIRARAGSLAAPAAAVGSS
jgi:LPPG:FO 2-phospho-L-lactate transferase